MLWPARDVKNRVEIIKDMFEDHMVTSKVSITSNPSLIKMFETNGKSEQKNRQEKDTRNINLKRNKKTEEEAK